jgi:hypothetical protein
MKSEEDPAHDSLLYLSGDEMLLRNIAEPESAETVGASGRASEARRTTTTTPEKSLSMLEGIVGAGSV